MLDDFGCYTDFIQLDNGFTRINVKINAGEETEINGQGPKISEEAIGKLYEKLENELSPREKLVLKMRYGLYQGEEYTQREIAAQLGISRSYVSRIEKSAIGKLRQYF